MRVWLVTELTPVSSVSVDYTCTTNSATVQWTAVLGAESYRAVAMGDNGTQLMCTSQGTSCRINGLDCGQSYVVHVTPVSESCTNLLNSTTATFQTGEKPLVAKLQWHSHQCTYVMLSSKQSNLLKLAPLWRFLDSDVLLWCLFVYIWFKTPISTYLCFIKLVFPSLILTCLFHLWPRLRSAHSLLIGQPFNANVNC